MTKFIRRVALIVLIAALVPCFLAAEGAAEQKDDITSSSVYASYSGKTGIRPTIVASTSWIASIVSLASDYPVTVLAPLNLKHPPEYDFKPQDIITAGKADLLFWGGYEGFMKRLFEAGSIDQDRIYTVQTGNTPTLIRENVERISKFLTTTEAGENGLAQVDALFEEMRSGVASLSEEERRAVVQFHQKGFIEALGFTVVAVIGPGELTVQDIKRIEELDFSLIADNYHSTQATSFKGEGRRYVELVNFPGPFGTESLISVLEHNGRQLSLLD